MYVTPLNGAVRYAIPWLINCHGHTIVVNQNQFTVSNKLVIDDYFIPSFVFAFAQLPADHGSFIEIILQGQFGSIVSIIGARIITASVDHVYYNSKIL